MHKKFDEAIIKEIQQYFDDKHSFRDIRKKFNINFSQLYALQNSGKLNLTRSKEETKEIIVKKLTGLKHSSETKCKISASIKKWILKNPDKSPYLLCHKSKGESYPEKYFREWLEKENIPFQQEYKFKSYSFDFLINERIDLEIDGSQHREDPVIIEHDKKRDKTSKNNGFIVLRIDWKKYKKLNCELQKEFLLKLKDFLLNSNNPIPQFVIEKKQPKIKKLKREDPRKYQALEMLKNGESFCKVGREFGVSDNAVRKWLKSIGEDPKNYSNRNKNL